MRPTIRRYSLLTLSLVAAVVLLLGIGSGGASAAGAGTAFTYQGQLSQALAPVTASCDFQFSLWDASAAGSQVGSTIAQTLAVSDGLFVTLLDFGSGAFGGAQRWLEISVGCPTGAALTTLSPRQELSPTPYAIRAGDSDHTDWSGLTSIPSYVRDYTAGTGLTLTGGQFAVDTSAVQVRVTGVCSPGNYVRAIASDGTVTCGADNGGTTYTAGAGLQLIGAEFSVITSTIQARISGTCSVGSAIRAIAADGSVTCQTDTAGPTYSAGAGIDLTGNVVTVVTSTIQQRVTGTCAIGQYVRSVAVDGSVTCGTDATGTSNPGTITGVTAGTGLTGGGITGTVVISANTSVLQSRVTGTCGTGEFASGVTASGGITCTTVTLDRIGNPLNDASITLGTKTVHWLFTSALGGMHWEFDAASGHPLEIITTGGTPTAGTHLLHIESTSANAMPVHIKTVAGGNALRVEGNTTITGTVQIGGPITATGTISATNYPPQACAAGSSIRSVAADGSVVCTTDLNSGGTITGVTAGTGLTGGGTSGGVSLSIVTSTVQQRVTGTCGAGNVMTGIAATGAVTCTADANSGGTVTGTATAGQVMYWGTNTAAAGDAGLTYSATTDILYVAGKVNIGAGSPSYPLDVTGDGRFTGGVNVGTTGAGVGAVRAGTVDVRDGGTVRFFDSGNSDYAYIKNDGSSSATQGLLYIAFGASGNGQQWKVYDGTIRTMQLTASGNLLLPVNLSIGGTSPAGRLDVRGANVGGFLFWDSPTFTSATQTILASGVNSGAVINYVCAGSSGNTASTTLITVALATVNSACGTADNIQWGISAGALTVKRQSGTGTLQLSASITWK